MRYAFEDFGWDLCWDHFLSRAYFNSWPRCLFCVPQFVNTEMKAYRLYTVVPRLVGFIEQLTNWYVRLNRNRLKGAEGTESARTGENVFLSAFGLGERVGGCGEGLKRSA